MNHPYIVSMLETQFKLEEQLKELDEVLKEPLPALPYNQILLARAGLASGLHFLTTMIEKTHQEIERGTLSDPSFNALLEEGG